MTRSWTKYAIALPVVAVLCSPLSADVQTREKTLVKFEGMLGRMVGLFGGKAAKEGIVATSAVKGDRKATMSDSTGQIIDLGEEKIYDLDLKKKEYKVTTFEEMRQRIKDAREQAEKDAKEQAGKEEQAKEKGYDVEVAKFPFSANGKAKGLGDTSGFVKLVADKNYNEIIGAHLIGPDVTELLPALTLAQKWDLSADEVARNIFAHPTLSEAVKEAVEGIAGHMIHM